MNVPSTVNPSKSGNRSRWCRRPLYISRWCGMPLPTLRSKPSIIIWKDAKQRNYWVDSSIGLVADWYILMVGI